MRYTSAAEGERAVTFDDVATAAVLVVAPFPLCGGAPNPPTNICGSEGLHALPSNPCRPPLRTKERTKERKERGEGKGRNSGGERAVKWEEKAEEEDHSISLR